MLKKLRERRAALRAAMDKILAKPTEENRSLTEDETTDLTEHRTELRQVDDLIELYEELAESDAADEGRADVAGEGGQEIRAGDTLASGGAIRELVAENAQRGAAGDTGQGTRVTANPLTYDRRNIRRSYLHDLAVVKLGVGDVAAASERLQAHAGEMRVEMPRLEERLFGTVDNPRVKELREEDEKVAKRMVEYPIDYERRDLSRTDGAGGEFVPPLWMVEDYVNLARAGRVAADLARGFPLPGGTDSINIPRVATGSSTAPQTADNAAVSETDLTTNSVSAPVRTIAGQQDIALQLLEQSPIAFDEVTFEDLANDHAEVLDTQVLNGSAAAGQMRGILQIAGVDTTTYTDASPTVPELYPALADSANEVATNRFRMPEVIKMHPRRWFWMLAALDSNSRPLVVPSTQGPQNALATVEETVAEGFAGRIFGIPVFLDPNMPTNLGGGTEDRVIFDRPSEQYLFEGPVRTRVLPEVGSGELTVRFQLYSYTAFIPDRRVNSVSIVAGTGLEAPTF